MRREMNERKWEEESLNFNKVLDELMEWERKNERKRERKDLRCLQCLVD
jgi:hypothetical protein